jgi:uncharacterized HAD superfamily protein
MRGYLDHTSSSLEQTGWDQFGLSPEQMSSVWDYILANRGWWNTLPPLIDKKTFSAIDDLKYDHQVTFVSARLGISPQRDTSAWLERHGIENPSVIITKRKGEIARALDIDYSIEDKPENAAVIHWMADVRPCKSYIIDRPYNQVDFLPKNIKRVKTVDEFLGEIN